NASTVAGSAPGTGNVMRDTAWLSSWSLGIEIPQSARKRSSDPYLSVKVFIGCGKVGRRNQISEIVENIGNSGGGVTVGLRLILAICSPMVIRLLPMAVQAASQPRKDDRISL